MVKETLKVKKTKALKYEKIGKHEKAKTGKGAHNVWGKKTIEAVDGIGQVGEKRVVKDGEFTNDLKDYISLQGVTTHNLKNIDVIIPKNKLVTVTGVSGSGKSSLAFHTLYKEGQFRYIESLSSYLRQFFNLGARPELEMSSGLSPAIAIEQNKSIGSSRSTVGTITEIDDYVRLLFAKLGDMYSYASGEKIESQTVDQIMDEIERLYVGKKVYLLQMTKSFDNEKDFTVFVKSNRNRVERGKGFTRYLIVGGNGKEENLDSSLKRSEGQGGDDRVIASSVKTSSQGQEGNCSSQGQGGKGSSQGQMLDPIEFFYLETANIPVKYFPIVVYGIYDRVTIEEKRMGRLKEDVIKILEESPKFGVYVESLNAEGQTSTGSHKGKKITTLAENIGLQGQIGGQAGGQFIKWFTDKNYDPTYDISYPEFTSQHFSPNRQEGACPGCHGLGEVLQVDFERVLDGKAMYLQALLPWRDSKLGQALLKKLAHKHDVDVDTRWSDLPDWFLHTVMYGDDELLRIPLGGGQYVSMYYRGVEDVLRDQFAKGLLTVDFQAMLEMKVCGECLGARLRKESLHVMLAIGYADRRSLDCDDMGLGGEQTVMQRLHSQGLINIHDIHEMSISTLVDLFKIFQQETYKSAVLVERITHPLLDRLQTIESLGLGYLTLSRGVKTLSGGETQRLRLAKQLGNKLTGIIYVLDEPTIGLDKKEIQRMIASVRVLQEMGNSIVVVEHQEDFIKASDWVIEVGPGAGDFGGEIVFNGPIDAFMRSDCLTAQYVRGEKTVTVGFEHDISTKSLRIKKASKYNLKHIDVDIPLGSFTIITGASGAGKTTLMYTTLFRFLHEKEKYIQGYIRLQLLKQGLSWQEIISAPLLKREQYAHYANLATQAFYEDLAVESVLGYEEIKNIVYVDQSSIGKTPRSCPATFIGVFDDIRQLFAGASDAKYLGFSTGYFSFNSSKGCCPGCKGYGYKKVELQFLPDTYVACEMCHGKRYKPEILDIKWRGVSISKVLDMYVDEALNLFSEMSHIHEQLFLMCEMGLGYLRMGQPAHSLSGGESQRLKLVKHLLKSFKGHTMYFLDEPTVGLHPHDITKLLKVLKRFLDLGDTVVMVEHDENLLKYADKVITLDDGRVV